MTDGIDHSNADKVHGSISVNALQKLKALASLISAREYKTEEFKFPNEGLIVLVDCGHTLGDRAEIHMMYPDPDEAGHFAVTRCISLSTGEVLGDIEFTYVFNEQYVSPPVVTREEIARNLGVGVLEGCTSPRVEIETRLSNIPVHYVNDADPPAFVRHTKADFKNPAFFDGIIEKIMRQ
ncbi:MAG: hypothetical protein AAB592_03365 [Patescibacteria group bacterium]